MLESSTQERNQGLRVVIDLVQDLKRYNVTCDNFFASYYTGQILLEKKLTIRKNEPTIPPQLLVKVVPNYASTFAFIKALLKVHSCIVRPKER